MNFFKVILSIIFLFAATILFIAPAQANCPPINEIIVAFDKNGLPPKNWLLVAYTGKQIDRNFQFAQASWSANSSYDKNAEGNLVCEYTSKNKTNPGYLIIQTTFTLPAPQGENWRHLADGVKTTICKSANNSAQCKF